jgi:hypothetical protein
MKHTFTNRILFASFALAFMVLFSRSEAAENADLSSNANSDTVKKSISDQSKMKFVQVRTGSKKSWKIAKEDLEIPTTRMMQCFCPDNPLVQVDCEDLEICVDQTSPFDPKDPWWEKEAGRNEWDAINARLQKMGMKLKVKEKGNRAK